MKIKLGKLVLDTGETIKQSTIQVSLQPSEQIFFYIYYNYTSSGNYNVTFTTFNDNYLESDTTQISV